MAKFTFKNVSNVRKAVNGTYDAPVSPALGYDVTDKKAMEFYTNAGEDFALEAGDVKIPVYDLGTHSMAVIHPGEEFVVKTEKAAEIAYYSDLACKLTKGEFKTNCIKVEYDPEATEGTVEHLPEDETSAEDEEVTED